MRPCGIAEAVDPGGMPTEGAAHGLVCVECGVCAISLVHGNMLPCHVASNFYVPGHGT